jgi:crotonobetainyl-CoA:carnitine CoA-transferase CaiB-like acyl-CoA transferase
MLGLQNEREWKLFCDKVLLQPALAEDPRFDTGPKRNEHRAELRAIILAAFASLTAQQVVERLDAAQIANARVNEVGELWTHPQLLARGRIRRIGSPAGELHALLPPSASSSFDYRMGDVPAVGQHTDAILRELGRSEAEIAAMRAARAV